MDFEMKLRGQTGDNLDQPLGSSEGAIEVRDSVVNKAGLDCQSFGDESKVILLEGKRMERARLAEKIDSALSALPVVEQHVVSELFGLTGSGCESATELAKELSATPDQIEGLREDALRRLRRSASKTPNTQYLQA